MRMSKRRHRVLNAPTDTEQDKILNEQTLFDMIKALNISLRSNDRFGSYESKRIINLYRNISFLIQHHPHLADLAHTQIFKIEVKTRKYVEAFYDRVEHHENFKNKPAENSFVEFAEIELTTDLYVPKSDKLVRMFFQAQLNMYASKAKSLLNLY